MDNTSTDTIKNNNNSSNRRRRKSQRSENNTFDLVPSNSSSSASNNNVFELATNNLEKQELVEQILSENQSNGPVKALLRAASDVFARTFPGKFIAKASEAARKHRTIKRREREARRLKDLATDTGTVIGLGVMFNTYRSLSLLTTPLISIVNIAGKAVGITTRDLIIISSQKKAGVIYYGIMIQSQFALPCGIVLTIICWIITVRIARLTVRTSRRIINTIA